MQRNAWMLCNLAPALGIGCGLPLEMELSARTQTEISDNGFALNGLAENGLFSNGLSRNGLYSNGLSRNGLSRNGLSSAEFGGWFRDQPAGVAYSDMVMRYVVKCAAPANTRLSATIDGLTYEWVGELGLAPEWVAGNPIPLVEQQLVTACLAALVNKFGAHVQISVLGYTKSGAAIPQANKELKEYPVKEGCFFGNLFTDEGVFVGNDSVWSADKSSLRDCAIAVSGKSNDNCPPLRFAGQCSKLCAADDKHVAYFNCTVDGKSYASINTRIMHEVIYQCGDHICQLSESCGTGNTPENCKDCGPCR